MAKEQKENRKAGCYSNRELSWLKFNERVLEEAADPDVPLCERLTFASIFQSNLDEFFMVRVGSLHDQMLFSPDLRENKTKMNSEEQIAAILAESRELCQKKDQVYLNLMAQLKEKGGVELIDFAHLSEEDEIYLEAYFNSEVKPLISPQVVGKRQPFPFLRNKEIYAVVELESKGSNKIGIVPCSNGLFERLVQLKTDSSRFLLVEELILHFAPQIFDHYKIKSETLLRVVRNADLETEEELIFDDISTKEEAPDYREAMAELIKRRKKLCAVRAELSRTVDKEVVDKLCEHLDLKQEQIFYTQSPLDLSFVFRLQDDLKRKQELFYEKRIPQKSAMVKDDVPMMDQIVKKDILLSYPYESIQPFLRLLNEASEDPEVVSVKMTLYRVARYSKVVEALIKAAENGKEVVVLVELRARFDEENNIEWSRRLEEAGCRIIYGLDGLKVHSKLCLITRKTKKKIQYITQIGTGNYNEKTSTLYTDYSLMTASMDIGLEALMVFNALSMGEICEPTKHLMVAPNGLQQGVLQLIEEEIHAAKSGERGYIGVKLNSLTDRVIIDKLIEASQAGVKIEMVVRGICCLNPGIKDFTENITIVSIVGRFLEHARIYMFGVGKRQRLYISSADFMTRNTMRRIEVAVRVESDALRHRISQMFAKMMADNVKGRRMKPDGTYVHRQARKNLLNSQEYFYSQAYEVAEAVLKQKKEKEQKKLNKQAKKAVSDKSGKQGKKALAEPKKHETENKGKIKSVKKNAASDKSGKQGKKALAEPEKNTVGQTENQAEVEKKEKE